MDAHALHKAHPQLLEPNVLQHQHVILQVLQLLPRLKLDLQALQALQHGRRPAGGQVVSGWGVGPPAQSRSAVADDACRRRRRHPPTLMLQPHLRPGGARPPRPADAADHIGGCWATELHAERPWAARAHLRIEVLDDDLFPLPASPPRPMVLSVMSYAPIEGWKGRRTPSRRSDDDLREQGERRGRRGAN